MDPPNVAIMFTWSSCFMLTCRGITRHDNMKYVNMVTQITATSSTHFKQVIMSFFGKHNTYIICRVIVFCVTICQFIYVYEM